MGYVIGFVLVAAAFYGAQHARALEHDRFYPNATPLMRAIDRYSAAMTAAGMVLMFVCVAVLPAPYDVVGMQVSGIAAAVSCVAYFCVAISGLLGRVEI